MPSLLKYPESAAFRAEIDSTEAALKSAHFARPPNKRPNFAKLGVASPFRPPFSVLVNDWRFDNDIERQKKKDEISVDYIGSGLDGSLVKVLRDETVLEEVRRGQFSGCKQFSDHLGIHCK